MQKSKHSLGKERIRENEWEGIISKMLEKKEEFRSKLEDGKEYYEIRLESIGGLGANLCGKMLGELGLRYLEVNSSNFSSYGSEKTGTPVKGYVRYCQKEKEIRLHSPVIEPDLLVVFHQALLKDMSVWKGCNQNTKVLIALENGKKSQSIFTEKCNGNNDKAKTVANHPSGNVELEKRNTLNKEKSVQFFGLEAQKIAMETHSRINVVMLGAILKLMGVKDMEPGERICRDTLGKKYPESLENNLEGMRRGYEEVRQLPDFVCEFENAVNTSQDCDENASGEAKWGYLNAPIGGINPNVGGTVTNDLSPSRQGYIPIFLKERCINCGLCFSACPDMVFQFKKGKYKGKDMMINEGLDYYHCKGCLRCVDVCPVNALVRGNEAEQEKKAYFMANQELVRMPRYYEKAGADGYITSESYLTEERMEGGEV